MDEDRAVQLRFEEDVFLATHLIVRTKSPVTFDLNQGPVEWTFAIDNSGKIVDQTMLNRARVEFEGSGINRLVSPIIRFNKNVNEASVTCESNQEKTGYVKTRLHAEDYKNSRIDYHRTSRRYYEELGIPNPNEAEIFLRSGDLAAWSSGSFTLNWGADIFSSETGNPILANPGFTTLKIAPPSVSVHLTRLEVLRDCDWDWGAPCCFVCFVEDDPEVRVISSSAHRSAEPVTSKFVFQVYDAVDAGVYDGMGEDEIKTPNQLIAYYEPVDYHGDLFLKFDVLDEDETLKTLVETLRKIADGLSDVKNDNTKESNHYVNAAISVVSAALSDLIEGDGPDHMANLHVNHSYGDQVWGGMPTTATNDPIKSREYELRNDVFSLKYKITLEPR
jgi:hypothetical protein